VPTHGLASTNTPPVISVVRATNVADAVWIAEQLAQAGFTCIELTTTIPNWQQALRDLKNTLNETTVTLGLGTVVTAQQAEEGLQLGAQFIAAPGFNLGVAKTLQHHSVPYWPGVFTPTEVMHAVEAGFSTLKLYPAALLGKPSTSLCLLKGPFPHVSFIPFGGIPPEGVAAWLNAGALAVGLGSCLMPTETVLQQRNSHAYLQQLERSLHLI
jgi:2-dehydro-3-deoxyphosphogluconate aldolase / (4S)-4-hydroxy-2-oxoglutarate aldolase